MIVQKRRGQKWRQAVALCAGVVLIDCGQTNEEAPKLPPAESMRVPAFFDADDNALTRQGGSQSHLNTAKLAVGLVTFGIGVALAIPTAVFVGTLTVEPQREDDGWVWKKSFPLLGFETALHGSMEDALQLRMNMSGTRQATSHIQDFMWFEGSHQLGSGRWTFYAPEVEKGAVLTIDWAIAGETERELVFRNVTTGQDRSGDTLTYRLDGTTASMTIHTVKNAEGNPEDFVVTWNTEDGSGSMARNDRSYCWDTFANDQVNLESCP